MLSVPVDPPGDVDVDVEVGERGPRETLQRWLISGAVLTIPALVTLVILAFAFDFVSSALDPLVGVLRNNLDIARNSSDLLVKAVTVGLLLGTVTLVGMLAEHTPTEGRVAEQFHRAVESVPGVGSVYRGFRQMSEVVVESDTDSFRDVKLVEFPTEGSYTLAFVTADTPPNLEAATGCEDMVTVFMPMAPNPVMGGHVLHVDRDRVVDVEMTVEEGIQSIVTSGVTAGGGERSASLSAEEMAAIGQGTGPGTDGFGDGATGPGTAEKRRQRYDDAVDAVHAGTPERIVERERDGESDPRGDGAPRPAEIARDPEDRERTDERPAERARREREEDRDGPAGPGRADDTDGDRESGNSGESGT